MAKPKKLVLPKEWRTFANRYGADRAYWYVPKGLAVTADALKPRLKVLKGFEHGKAWRDCQQAYIQSLNEKGLSQAEAEWADGGAPLARMLKQVFIMLGLAWVDADDRVEITPAGDKFLTDKDPGGVLSDQMSRYQFTNPSVASNAHKAITLHPIPFIGEVLRNIDGQSFTGPEYTLFISRAKSFADVDSVIEQIEAFREKDWIAYFGDPKAPPTIDTALDYYVNKGDVAAAIATKKKTAKSAKELADFQNMIVSEKSVEDYLENHLDVVGSKIGRKLNLIGRQYSTTVGPIDLLAVDANSGDYVVIELKKGRSADKVYGQCSRYMGWIRKNLATGAEKVHGVIVAREIDDKLKATRDAHDTKVGLIEFEMKIGARAV